MPITDYLLIAFVVIGVPIILIGVPAFLLSGGLQGFALKPLMKRFIGLELHETPQPGDVYLVYHTYRGFLFWFVQAEHRVYAPPEDARRLLGRLLQFNLTWGLLANAMLFIPFVALANYYLQKRSIARQVNELAAANASEGK